MSIGGPDVLKGEIEILYIERWQSEELITSSSRDAISKHGKMKTATGPTFVAN